MDIVIIRLQENLKFRFLGFKYSSLIESGSCYIVNDGDKLDRI
jgi:hypothetical protein